MHWNTRFRKVWRRHCGRTILALLVGALPAGAWSATGLPLRGEIVDRDGNPAGELIVELHGDGRRLEKVFTLPDGQFEFREVPAGQYELRITNGHGDAIRREFVSIRGDGAALVIRLDKTEQSQPVSGRVSVKRLMNRVPGKARREFVRAQRAAEKDDIQASIEHLQKAIAYHPDYIEAHNNLGVRYMHLGKFATAAAEFRKAAELDPGAFTYANLALALVAQKELADAEWAARRALDFSPYDLRGSYALGLALAGRNECTPEAVQSLTRAATQYPRAFLTAARLLVCRGEIDDAATQLRRYLELPEVEHRPQVESWLNQLQGSK